MSDTYIPGEQPTQPIQSYHARSPIDIVREALERVESIQCATLSGRSRGLLGAWSGEGRDLLEALEQFGRTADFNGPAFLDWAHMLATAYARRVREVV